MLSNVVHAEQCLVQHIVHYALLLSLHARGWRQQSCSLCVGGGGGNMLFCIAGGGQGGRTPRLLLGRGGEAVLLFSGGRGGGNMPIHLLKGGVPV